MSWTPTFWIEKSDYEKIEKDLSQIEYMAWEFEVAGKKGVVFGLYSETTRSHKELHLLLKDVKHYLLDSESSDCVNCVEWGKKIS